MSVTPQKLKYPSSYVAETATRKRCPDCGLHIRGKNHDKGDDHDRGVSRRSRKAAGI